jgi:acyl-CoA reductase-like NAD-dependent aldehyde dehydrogenase
MSASANGTTNGTTGAPPSVYHAHPAPFVRVQNYIHGQYLDPLTSKKTLSLGNPATGRAQGEVVLSGADDVAAAVESAKKAFPIWSKMTVKARALILFRYHQLIEKYSDELCELITREHGKNKVEALGDLQKGNETVEYACSLPQLIQGKILE